MTEKEKEQARRLGKAAKKGAAAIVKREQEPQLPAPERKAGKSPKAQVWEALVKASREKDPFTKGRLEAGTPLIGASVAVPILKTISDKDEQLGYWAELAVQLVADLAPKTAAERMLVEQLLVTHAQLLNAHRLIPGANTWDAMEKAASIASRLAADFRKTLLTLKEWRAPVRQFVVAQQANIAQQQVIQNSEKNSGANEQTGNQTGHQASQGGAFADHSQIADAVEVVPDNG